MCVEDSKGRKKERGRRRDRKRERERETEMERERERRAWKSRALPSDGSHLGGLQPLMA